MRILILVSITILLSGCGGGFRAANIDPSSVDLSSASTLCTPNAQQSCQPANGTGAQTCTSSGSAWGACVATSCNSGYNLQGGSCVQNTTTLCTPNAQQSCPIGNGTGSQTCNGTGSAWGACGNLTSCNSGYILQNGICVVNIYQRAQMAWQNLFPDDMFNMNKYLADGDTLRSIYDMQYHLMNFAIRVRRENDIQSLSQLCELASTYPLQRLVNSSGAGQNTPNSWQDITEPLTWADAQPYAGNYDDLNNVVQWMYFTGYLMHSVALVDPSSRTAVMNRFLDVYSMIFARNVREMVFNADNAMGWDFRGWGNSCSPTKLSHYDITAKKYSWQMTTNIDPTAPCNAVLDWDEQLWGATLEWLAAVKIDPAHVNIFNDDIQPLGGYLRTAYDAVENHFSWSTLTNFQGNSADGYLFNKGLWSTHPDYVFAGNSQTSPPVHGQEAPVSGVGEDMGHHIRLTWVLLSFYENKAVVGRTFPTDAEMKYYANQMVYKVFNRDFVSPKFTTFNDGSNGWFRLFNYNGTPNSTNAGPWTGSLAAIMGAYGFYRPFQPDISRMMDAMAPAYMMSDSAGDAARASLSNGYLQGCAYSASDNSWSSCAPYPSYVGFRSDQGESLAFFSQYGL